MQFIRVLERRQSKLQNHKNENFVLQRLYGWGPSKPSPKFKLNDTVRVLPYRGTFDKWYLLNWSKEYYRVIKIENTKPPVYKLCDMQDEVLTGTFYRHEL